MSPLIFVSIDFCFSVHLQRDNVFSQDNSIIPCSCSAGTCLMNTAIEFIYSKMGSLCCNDCQKCFEKNIKLFASFLSNATD